MIFKKKTILIDINLLPSEYEKSLKGVKQYAKDFNVNVVPFDRSPMNAKGTNTGNPISI